MKATQKTRSFQKQDRAFQRQSKTGIVKRSHLAANGRMIYKDLLITFDRLLALCRKRKRDIYRMLKNKCEILYYICSSTIQRWRLEIESLEKTSTLVVLSVYQNLITFIFRLSTLLATQYFSVRAQYLINLYFPTASVSVCQISKLGQTMFISLSLF